MKEYVVEDGVTKIKFNTLDEAKEALERRKKLAL